MINYIAGKTRKLMLPNGEEHKAIYAIVDLSDITASHNERTFNDSLNYPTENGRNINDRNYKDDVAAQRNVQKIARKLVPETLISLSSTPSGTPIINKDGFVVSGNNRVMSLKLAIKEYPDNYEKYVDQLKEDCDSFNIEYDKRMNTFNGKRCFQPILVRIDESLPIKLNTEVLAAYNQDTKKGERPVDKAIKLASILNSNERCKNTIVSIVDGYDNFSDLYSLQGKSDRKRLVDTFVQCGLIPEAQLPIYFDNGEFTEGGKDYIETLLSAIILTPDALKVIGAEGVKKYRQTIISSLPVLITNKALMEDDLTRDISDAVILQYKIVQVGGDFSDFTHSQSLFSEDKPKEKALYLNALLRSGKNTFKAAVKRYTDSVKDNEGASLFGEKLLVKEIFDKTIVSAIDNGDKKLIEQLYKNEDKVVDKAFGSMRTFEDVKEEPKEDKKGVSLGFGSMGNGTTVWDRNTTRNGDYVTVAHISDYGEVKYYSGVFLPDYAKKEIENYASTIREKMKASTYKIDAPKNKGKLKLSDIPDIVKEFMPTIQQKAIVGSEEHWDTLSTLESIIKKMPSTYGTEDIEEDDKIVYLHYFYGGSDWYIVEKDSEMEQLQAFGYVVLNGDHEMAEWGYISIEELKRTNRVELDFYFEPTEFGELKKEWNGESVKIISEEHLEPNTFEEFNEAVFEQIIPDDDFYGNLIKVRKIKNQLRDIVNGANESEIHNLYVEYENWHRIKNRAKVEHTKQYEFYKGVSYDYKNPYEYNKAVEELIKDKETFTSEEKAFISYYSGYGGLEKFGATGKGLLYEYFTPKVIVDKMWGLAYKYGFVGGYVLEPSIGVGEFAKFAPDLLKVTGYEINPNSAKICKILYPDATIINEAFETIFIKNRASVKNKLNDVKKYSLVIGNPPYGDFGGLYAGMGEKGYTKAENYIDYFITRGLDLLEPNGLLIMIIGAEVATGGKPFLSKGMSTVKKEIMDKAILVDAYRLPNGVFERTDVLTDIIVLRKK